MKISGLLFSKGSKALRHANRNLVLTLLKILIGLFGEQVKRYGNQVSVLDVRPTSGALAVITASAKISTTLISEPCSRRLRQRMKLYSADFHSRVFGTSKHKHPGEA